jgi:hypothetical protein
MDCIIEIEEGNNFLLLRTISKKGVFTRIQRFFKCLPKPKNNFRGFNKEKFNIELIKRNNPRKWTRDE